MAIVDLCPDKAEFDLTDPEKAHRLWWHFMRKYADRELTFEKERLPALTSSTEFFRPKAGLTPLLGLWLETLSRDMLWLYEKRAAAPGIQASSRTP
jgi:hypothetical protein